VQVHLKLPIKTNGVTIPSSSLLFRSEGLQVGLVRNGHAELVPIVIGRDYGFSVEVISGLTPEDEVILSPPDSLITGALVRIADQRSAEQ
jgi:multidrug efflux pump subunit AcrA (membrane-fusion protein)